MTTAPARPVCAAVARFDKFAVFVHEKKLHLYENTGKASDPYAICTPLAPVDALPDCYLRHKRLAACIQLAAEEYRARLALAGA